MKFSQATQEKIGHYVYCLVDPRDKRVFYIGKGVGNRIFDHVGCAIEGDVSNYKLDTIRAIHSEGKEVIHYIVRSHLTNDEAVKIESTLIDFLTYPAFNMERVLTNIVSGAHVYDEGIVTSDEVNIRYNCPKIDDVQLNEGVLLVCLNKTYNQKKAESIYQRSNIYEATRKYWYIGRDRPKSIRYVLGVCHGIVRCVIRVEGYKWVDQTDEGFPFPKPRCCFEGEVVEDSPLLNKDVSDYPFGSGGVIRYIKCNLLGE